MDIAQLTIPSKQVTIRANDKPWFNSRLRQLKCKCIRKFKTFKNDRNSQSWKEYKELQKKYQNDLIECKLEYETNRYNKINIPVGNRDKQWWKVIKDVTNLNGKKESIPNLENKISILFPVIFKSNS